MERKWLVLIKVTPKGEDDTLIRLQGVDEE